MDKKQLMALALGAATLLPVSFASTPLEAQNIKSISFADKKYEYGEGKDTITLFFNLLDSDGEHVDNLHASDLESYLVVREDGKIIPASQAVVEPLSGGQRIPAEYTFSVLVDLSIPGEGKLQIFQAIETLVESAPDSCVYLSFFGDEVSESRLVTRDNILKMRKQLNKGAENKYFYSALYAKLSEFSASSAELEDEVKMSDDYEENTEIARRAALNRDKNILFVFTEGTKRPTYEENIAFAEVKEYQQSDTHIVPRVYAFYYTEEDASPEIEACLEGICDSDDPDRQGDYMPANDMEQVLTDFQRVVSDQMYTYSFAYCVPEGRSYSGAVEYVGEWKGDKIGEATFTIGSAENPWPIRAAKASDSVAKYFVALILMLLTIVVILCVNRLIIPGFRSKAFERKYYKNYVPQANVRVLTCRYCGQPVTEGELVVQRCKHTMHARCWKENGYKCAEYGQNCTEGIQPHGDWRELFSSTSMQENRTTIHGIIAAFIGWIIYEVTGRGGWLQAISEPIVNMCYSNDGTTVDLTLDCISRVSAMLCIGLLLGFLLSLVFRYNDEYRTKDAKIWLRIIGLSLLTALIGMLAFALGGVILCLLLSAIAPSYIAWYCSLPAYMLFSVCVALALTIGSSIPVRSALIGGGVAAVIGFIVLSLSALTPDSMPWMSMLLNFIIFGGGLGASLVTVRMLAEKYFLTYTLDGVEKRIPIHKWMNATGGGNKVKIGMTIGCEIQMNWERSGKVAKEHAELYIDHDRSMPVIKSLYAGILFNNRTDMNVGQTMLLTNGDSFRIGDTTFKYVENQ